MTEYGKRYDDQIEKLLYLMRDLFRDYGIMISMRGAREHALNAYVKGCRMQIEGEWLPSPDGVNPIRCNKCNTPAPFAFLEDEFGDTGIHRYPWNYCPYCGAKMKGGESDARY